MRYGVVYSIDAPEHVDIDRDYLPPADPAYGEWIETERVEPDDYEEDGDYSYLADGGPGSEVWEARPSSEVGCGTHPRRIGSVARPRVSGRGRR